MSPLSFGAWAGMALLFASELALGLVIARKLVEWRLLPKAFLLLGTIAAICVIGYVSYFTHIVNYESARWVTRCIIAWGILAIAHVLYHWRQLWAERQQWLIPFGIMIVLAASYTALSLTCRYSTLIWGEEPVVKACVFRDRPEDNYLPFMFAERIVTGEKGLPVAGWTQTDRPPLEIGVMIGEIDGVVGGVSNSYQAQLLGVFLQVSWVAAIWPLFEYVGESTRARNLTMALLAVSGFAYFNGIYVWSKMLAGAFAAAGTMLLLYEKTPGKLPEKREIMAGAVFTALALLSHDGVIFSVIPTVIWFAWRAGRHLCRQTLDYKAVLYSAAAAFGLLIPWYLFKAHNAPPGDHLIKLQLAGVSTIDHTSTLQAIIAAYTKLSPLTWLQYRWDNVETIFFNPIVIHAQTMPQLIQKLQYLDFFSVFFALGFLNIGLGLFAIKRRERGQAERIMIRIVLWSFLIWVVILFNPYATTIHQGSYACMFFLFMLGGMGLVYARRSVQMAVFGAQAVYMYVIWIVPYLH